MFPRRILSSTTRATRHHHVQRISQIRGITTPSDPKKDLDSKPGDDSLLKPNLDRHTLKPESDEYSKSGGDHAAAAQQTASFNPSDTDPASEKEVAGKGTQVNPLEMSPANREASQVRGEREGMPERGVDRTAVSKRGGGKKGKEVRQYDDGVSKGS